MPQMIIANRLADGAVVFLASGDIWVQAIAEGRVLEQGDEAEQALAVAKRHEAENAIVEPSLIEIDLEGSQPRPVAIREAIRAFGPTVGTEQSGGGAGASSPVQQPA